MCLQVLAEERSRLEGHLADQKAAFDEERARLLQELYEQQGLDIDAQLAASAHSVRALQEQRDALRSSSGGRAAAGSGRSARSVAAKEESSRLEAAIKMLEKKLDDEVAHAKVGRCMGQPAVKR